jgi:PPOX class probable F420-dependent enzyme
MNDTEARLRFTKARVAILATADASGVPHLVPITFVVDGASVYSAVDGKPKQGRHLRRHDNIRAQPRVSLLVENWAEDWSRLWWVRADGIAKVTEDESTVDRVARLLQRKYQQYDQVGIGGPVIEVDVRAWLGWSGGQA